MKDKATTKPFYNSSIPSDWATPEFGTVFCFLKSFSFSREQLTDEKTADEIQNIHYGDIHATFENEILDFETESRIPFVKDGLISKDVFSDEEFPLLKDGDLIIADASEDTVGVAECVELKNINGRKIVSGLHTFGARDNNGKTAAGYRTYILNHPQVVRELRRIATGFSVFGVSKTNIAKVKLPLPPNREQKAIAHILSMMDTAISKNNLLIAKKELQKNWLMQNLLTGKKRLKGFEKEKWKETTMSTMFHRVTRKNSEVNTNVVTISAQRGFVRQTDFFNKTIASEILDNYFLVEKGEFCYNKSYSNGYPWGATKRLKDYDKAVVTTLYICFGIKDEKKNSGDFFEQFFEANLLDKGLTKIAHEGGRAHGLLNVTPSDFFSLKITIPNVEEQASIALVLRVADKEIQILKTKTEKLREQKKGLMQVLLTGKKRLKIEYN
jgi:type I restriction enzyme, S subunit